MTPKHQSAKKGLKIEKVPFLGSFGYHDIKKGTMRVEGPHLICGHGGLPACVFWTVWGHVSWGAQKSQNENGPWRQTLLSSPSGTFDEGLTPGPCLSRTSEV
jgi:hypothetical protein